MGGSLFWLGLVFFKHTKHTFFSKEILQKGNQKTKDHGDTNRALCPPALSNVRLLEKQWEGEQEEGGQNVPILQPPPQILHVQKHKRRNPED